MTFLFSIAATWLTGRFKTTNDSVPAKIEIDLGPMIKKTVLLAVVIWPLIYFLAGYLIAWQFDEVRMLYSGTTEMGSFVSIMEGNFASGLYFFQIFRGVLWVLIAMIVLTATEGSLVRKGVILGLLISFLGSSQLLLPNPFMSDMVRMGHLVETATSSFLWGFIMALYLGSSITGTDILKAP
jgi:hypothetical protein